MQSLWPLCFLAALGPARLYDVTVETGMPHLEENLRYATTHGERCLARNDLASAFPILDHPSLAGCKLREQSSDENTVVYVLVCNSDTETTGTATWHLGEHVIRGTLDVKLGGKSMTFFQRVTGTAIGDCPSSDPFTPQADTGSENYGGPLVTASGVLFIGATVHDRKIRAFHTETGALLWEHTLPFPGTATPITYIAGGKQYIVIATSAGRGVDPKPGAAYVGISLPEHP